MNKKDHISFDNNFDILLQRWFDGDLHGTELTDFEADPRFVEYQQINKQSKNITIPPLNQNLLLKKGKIIEKEIVGVKVIALWKKLTSIAVIGIITFAIMALFSADISVNSHHAIQLSHVLPDDSQVILNSDSELEYNNNFTEERTLNLDGEAFFQVEKGKSFTVATDEGSVVVIGTSFNVLSRDGVFIVSCKTGKVQVSSNNQSKVITLGERIRFTKGLISSVEKVDPLKIDNWTSGESYFERAPLQEVINSMSHKYDIDINLPILYHGRLYTGSYIHSDLEKAIKMVLVPMGIEYGLDNDKVKIY